jgi:hypothetical protein
MTTIRGQNSRRRLGIILPKVHTPIGIRTDSGLPGAGEPRLPLPKLMDRDQAITAPTITELLGSRS